MEALAVVGLVGNIVQFIDFTSKILKHTASAYQSQTGSPNGIRDLEMATETLQDLSKSLSLDGHIQVQGPASKQKLQALQKLAHDCQKTAHELLSALYELRAKNPKSMRSNFRAALATIWKKSEIDDLDARLNRYRASLIVQLQVIQNDNLHTMFFALMNDFNDKNHKLGTHMDEKISNLKMKITKGIESLKLELTNTDNQSPRADQATKQSNVYTLAASLVQSEMSGANMIASISLLESLVFEEMEYRHSSIRQAHPESFDHVLDSRIIPWLQSTELLYWISGKPGSGKSTLMKFLADDPRTRAQMQQCLGSRKASIASYYFWINGSQLQRSQEGLLRRLLYEILSQNSHLIEQAIPQSWVLARTMVFGGKALHTHTWKRDELLAAFQKLAALGMNANSLCIFIDGLDEYSGDCDEIIAIIEHLKAMQIKICVSSRPWNPFEEAFGHNQGCKLYLQDLNRPDIELYVCDNLQNRQDFKALSMKTSKTQEIVEEIVEKSQGVFLWVVLVVRSLVKGLRNRDGLALLEKRLKAFPSDLDEFFRYMFDSIDPIYRKSVAHMFEMALYGLHALPAIAYWYMDELDDTYVTWKNLMHGSENDSVEERRLSVQARINGRSMGLLELHKNEVFEAWEMRIDFLHRTARDYVQTAEIKQRILSWKDKHFDPQYMTCNSLIAAANLILKGSPTKQERYGDLLMHMLLELAESLERRNEVMKFEYAEAMEQLVLLKTYRDPIIWYLGHHVPKLFTIRLTGINRYNPTYHQKLNMPESYFEGWINPIQFAILLSAGPIVEISKENPDCMAEIMDIIEVKVLLDFSQSIMQEMRAICKGIAFENDVFPEQLDRKLRMFLQPHEMEELLETIVHTRRRMEEQNMREPENT